VSLASLRIKDLRSVRDAELDFGPRLNLIHGANGSGKTSILEAAFLVGRGRSFRTRHTEALISRGEPAVQLFSRTEQPSHRIGVHACNAARASCGGSPSFRRDHNARLD
jgi:DNA replication and repair protein RecF